MKVHCIHLIAKILNSTGMKIESLKYHEITFNLCLKMFKMEHKLTIQYKQIYEQYK